MKPRSKNKPCFTSVLLCDNKTLRLFAGRTQSVPYQLAPKPLHAARVHTHTAHVSGKVPSANTQTHTHTHTHTHTPENAPSPPRVSQSPTPQLVPSPLTAPPPPKSPPHRLNPRRCPSPPVASSPLHALTSPSVSSPGTLPLLPGTPPPAPRYPPPCFPVPLPLLPGTPPPSRLTYEDDLQHGEAGRRAEDARHVEVGDDLPASEPPQAQQRLVCVEVPVHGGWSRGGWGRVGGGVT